MTHPAPDMSLALPSQRPARLRRLTLILVLLALALILPPVVLQGYGLDLLSEVMIFAIAAISLDLLLGFGGLVSFGHAAFFGVGAYATVILGVKFGFSPWVGILGAIVFSTVAAALIGALCVRMSGVGFFMLTLAFAQLLYSAAVKWRPLTGGSDGMGGLPRPELFGLSLSDPRVMYGVAFAALTLVFVAARFVIGSQFGHALVGLCENDARMRALGYPTQRLKLIAFILSGMFAGVGGSLYALYNGFVSPDALSWGMSGTLLLMVVLGGAGTLAGPVVGAAVFLLMKNFVSSHTEHWLLIVGVVFVGCVMFFPKGFWGVARRVLGTDEP